ncbi:MAG: hypothetical protein O2999_10665 [Nitrospirae bacterium]|nr:hypothetical protein [Nitrospirota bacterium]MDA1304745.1 hypothetical protein [Nitrospirota bacterium]
MTKSFISLVILILSFLSCGQAEAKFGWADADIVLDFGIEVEPGERQIIIDQAEVGYPFHVDVVWKLHSENCLIQTLQDRDGDGTSKWSTLPDDRLFHNHQAHAIASNIEALAVAATKGQPCSMNPQHD